MFFPKKKNIKAKPRWDFADTTLTPRLLTRRKFFPQKRSPTHAEPEKSEWKNFIRLAPPQWLSPLFSASRVAWKIKITIVSMDSTRFPLSQTFWHFNWFPSNARELITTRTSLPADEKFFPNDRRLWAIAWVKLRQTQSSVGKMRTRCFFDEHRESRWDRVWWSLHVFIASWKMEKLVRKIVVRVCRAKVAPQLLSVLDWKSFSSFMAPSGSFFIVVERRKTINSRLTIARLTEQGAEPPKIN